MTRLHDRVEVLRLNVKRLKRFLDLFFRSLSDINPTCVTFFDVTGVIPPHVILYAFSITVCPQLRIIAWYNKPMEKQRTPEFRPAPMQEVAPEQETAERELSRVSVDTEPAHIQDVQRDDPITDAQVAAPVELTPKPEELQRIESILSEDLGEIYKALPDEIKPAFKQKGEEVAQQINTWWQEAALKAKRVLKLIRSWLGMIPQVSTHFLEQESKIKTDQIMAMAEEEL